VHIPRKRFGQHFLCDQAIIQQIVAALAPQPTQHLIEIGPGQGAITLPVLKRAKYLEAIELDRDLIPQLQERCDHAGRLHIYAADVLDFDFATAKKDERLLRIFGNLPYNISTPLIFHLINYSSIISDMVFMVQKEVAQRLAAATDTEHFGRLSVMVQYHWQVDLLFDVPATAFHPPPQVESSIVRLTPYRELPCPANNYEIFAEVVKQAFGQRRKTLRNSLKHIVTDEVWEKISNCSDLRSDLRAENLSVKDFVLISNSVNQA
jgi:16S rRNA (adenine1518-N6/adenine1519-N6)-dimethyltransferase